MRILWFAMTSSCYDVRNTGSWIEALEKIFKKYLPDVELGIAFEHQDEVFKVDREGVTYYPIHIQRTSSPKNNYELLRPHYLKVIEDFKPDIIHCFGTERWHYGLMAKEVEVPFVIHIMGFMNIYDPMDEIVLHEHDYIKYFKYNPIKYLIHKREYKTKQENQELERGVMTANKYFMGRTEWDKNIVKYYSPGSAYYHCEEAIREEIYNAPIKWTFHPRKKITLITIGNAGSLKGNEMMLRTAWLLKNQFHFDFEWFYTSNEYTLSFFENVVGIKHDDVNIKLIGRLDALEIAKQLADADFYIHPAIIDNSPNTVCEAQLIGTPIISTNAGGIPSLIEDGKTGFLYPYSEPHALAFKIMNMAGNKEELEQVSDNEYRVSHNRHNPETIAKDINLIYKTIISDYNTVQSDK